MNKIEEKILVLLIGDYILDEMNKDKQIHMLPSPFRYLRDIYLKIKLNNLKTE